MERAGGAGFTTVWGGCGVAASGILSLAVEFPFVTLDGVTALGWYAVPPPTSSVILAAAALILAAALCVLAFGLRNEPGLVGDSRLGKSAIVVFVAVTIASTAVRIIESFSEGLTTNTSLSLLQARGYLLLALGAVALACLVIAAAVVLRRRALNRPLRWGIAVVLGCTVLGATIWYIPVLPLMPVASFVIVASDSQVLLLLLQTVLGAGIALHGQSEALRRRAAIINAHW